MPIAIRDIFKLSNAQLNFEFWYFYLTSLFFELGIFKYPILTMKDILITVSVIFRYSNVRLEEFQILEFQF